MLHVLHYVIVQHCKKGNATLHTLILIFISCSDISQAIAAPVLRLCLIWTKCTCILTNTNTSFAAVLLY